MVTVKGPGPVPLNKSQWCFSFLIVLTDNTVICPNFILYLFPNRCQYIWMAFGYVFICAMGLELRSSCMETLSEGAASWAMSRRSTSWFCSAATVKFLSEHTSPHFLHWYIAFLLFWVQIFPNLIWFWFYNGLLEVNCERNVPCYWILLTYTSASLWNVLNCVCSL